MAVKQYTDATCRAQPGDHVTMTYRGRDLLGEVVLVNHPRKPGAYAFLTVKHFNGEFWPLEPLCWEVRVLERTYPEPDSDQDEKSKHRRRAGKAPVMASKKKSTKAGNPTIEAGKRKILEAEAARRWQEFREQLLAPTPFSLGFSSRSDLMSEEMEALGWSTEDLINEVLLDIWNRGFNSGYGAYAYTDVQPGESRLDAAYESEQNSRDYSPFEVTASEINRMDDKLGEGMSDVGWEAYDAGVEAGIQSAVRIDRVERKGRRGNPRKGQRIMKKHNPHYSISQWVDSEIDQNIEGELQERGLSSRDTDSLDFSHTPELTKAAERFTKEAVRVVKGWVKKNPKLAEDLKESDDLDSDDDIAWNTWANIVGHGVGFWENMTKADYASLDKAISSDKKLANAYAELENQILDVVNAGFDGLDAHEENPRSRPQRHKDVKFHVQQGDLTWAYYDDANEATAIAVARSLSNGRPVTLDVVVSSRAGAKWYGGDHAVEVYNEDPEASIHERIVIRAESQGRIA